MQTENEVGEPDMRRRDFIVLIGAAACGRAARAQQPDRRRRIGVLDSTAETDPDSKGRLAAFLGGLQERGWVQGRNLTVELRYAEGKLDRLPSLAAELVSANVDVIVAAGTEPIQAAKRATIAIPIVMATIGDPVGTGVVASLARPGGNVTGLSLLATDLSAKRLELIKEVLPNLARVAVLWNPNNASVTLKFQEIETAGRELGVQVASFEARDARDLEIGFATVAQAKAEALITTEEGLQLSHRSRIIDLALGRRLPVMSEFKLFAAAGALMSYGPSVPDLWRRSANYVDKIFNGSQPGDLPVEQPTKFELVINLKTAKAIGLDVPPTLLARADEVIE
jgi:putative tryptophan/tyrosine transport system substrate-binding protein